MSLQPPSQHSKYASLPDIDSAPDVYETPDVPSEVSHSYDSDSDGELPRAGSPSLRRGEKVGATATSENIDAGRLDTSEARRRFGEASLGGEEVPYTNGRRPSRRLPSTKTYSLNAGTSSSEKETTLERLRRLRSEIEELEEDVRREKADEEQGISTPTDIEGSGKGKKKEVSSAIILQQLRMLRGDLGGVEGVIGASGDGDLEGEGQSETAEALAQKARITSSLLSRFGLAGAGSARSAGTTGGSKAAGAAMPAETSVLEKRVAEVEKVLGASEADIDESHPLPPPLLHTLTRLDHLLTLLTQPRHLDSISRRVKVLVSDLERLHEARRKLGDTRPLNVALSGGMTVAVPGTTDGKGSTVPSGLPPVAPVKAIAGGGGGDAIPPDTLQKIDALFTLLPRLDPLLPLTPRLLTRLRSLAALHSSAATFGETLSGVQREVDGLSETEKGLQEVLDGLGKSLQENEEKVKANFGGLEERLQAVMQRMESLQQ